MTESSTESKNVEVAEATPAKEQATVPVAAVGAARAKARAAEGEVERLQQELAKAWQAQDGKIDPSAVSDVVGQMMVEARQKIEAEVRASMDAELSKHKFAAKMGLNEKQIDSVTAMQGKYPGMPIDEALALARTKSPDLFPVAAQPTWNRAMHGGLPVTGASEARSEQKTDFTAEMHKAAAAKDYNAAQQWAAKAFQERLYLSYPHMRPRNG